MQLGGGGDYGKGNEKKLENLKENERKKKQKRKIQVKNVREMQKGQKRRGNYVVKLYPIMQYND
jgi:hypothetical protein